MSWVNDLCWEIRFAKIPVMNLCDFLSGIAGGFNKAAINGTECILQYLLAEKRGQIYLTNRAMAFTFPLNKSAPFPAPIPF
ncbi:hypothetical protein [Pseudomonas alvandae]|uniref:Uncharacterized protein n=1 Tax=Pseudomonas canavaninivorans TaxID=2842348 RepID=A0ABX8QG10_PSECO|nr:hypothetical protein [Pseudomonas alvandae]QXI54285.1 hypothetical protein KSS97_04870 [Pseudomonas alvandae]